MGNHDESISTSYSLWSEIDAYFLIFPVDYFTSLLECIIIAPISHGQNITIDFILQICNCQQHLPRSISSLQIKESSFIHPLRSAPSLAMRPLTLSPKYTLNSTILLPSISTVTILFKLRSSLSSYSKEQTSLDESF